MTALLALIALGNIQNQSSYTYVSVDPALLGRNQRPPVFLSEPNLSKLGPRLPGNTLVEPLGEKHETGFGALVKVRLISQASGTKEGWVWEEVLGAPIVVKPTYSQSSEVEASSVRLIDGYVNGMPLLRYPDTSKNVGSGDDAVVGRPGSRDLFQLIEGPLQDVNFPGHVYFKLRMLTGKAKGLEGYILSENLVVTPELHIGIRRVATAVPPRTSTMPENLVASALSIQGISQSLPNKISFLQDAVFENASKMIPAGTYEGKVRTVSNHNFVIDGPSGQLGKKGDFLLEVICPPRTDILFHSGWLPEQSEGCVLGGPATSENGRKVAPPSLKRLRDAYMKSSEGGTGLVKIIVKVT